jgi:RNA polymerase sigma factor (sigma-70 family)
MQPEAEPELAQLNRTFRPALMAFFLRRLRNHAEAEDLTQEVFMRLAAAKSDQVKSTDAYVFSTAANLLRDRGRREKVRAEYRAGVWASEGVGIDPFDPNRIVVGREALAAVAAALKDLPETTRTIFVLYRLENVDKRAIADAFGLSTSSVDRQLAKAMTHLTRRVRGAE